MTSLGMISLGTISPATVMTMLRGLHLAAMLSLLGTVGFIAWMLPAAGSVPDSLRLRLALLCRISGLVAVVTGAAWFAMQGAVIADANNVAEVLHTLPVVAAHTRYGTMLMARMGLLLAAMLVAGPLLKVRGRTGHLALGHDGAGNPWARVRLAFVLALTMIALGLQGFIGHVGAAEGSIGDGLVLSEALHLIAAGIWLGSLVPLWLSLRALPPAQAASVCEQFSPIGLACVLVLAGTGTAQGLQLIGSIPGLLGTPYGHMALLKISLFLLAMTLAGINRFWLTDRMAAGATNGRRHLSTSIAIETAIGLGIVITAGCLASTVPAVHSVPVWPFSWRFSLTTLDEDAGSRREVIVSLLLIGGAVLLMAAAFLWRRLRAVTFAILVFTVLLRAPSLTLLTVPAYPTSFQISPTGFAAISIAHGEALFARDCAVCHGPEGEGDGPAAAGLHVRPASLTMPHIWEHTDGDLFWWLTHGIDDPEGRVAMPGFGTSLSIDDRWALIDYLRAHTIGISSLQDSDFGVPVRAPAFPIACDDAAASVMADLRGHPVHVIVGEAAKYPPPVQPRDGPSMITLLVASDEAADARPAPGVCVAADPAAWNAFAVLAGVPLDEVAGTEFLVDPDGWLRIVQRPGAIDGWHSSNDLFAAIRGISAHPIEQRQGAQHDHRH